MLSLLSAISAMDSSPPKEKIQRLRLAKDPSRRDGAASWECLGNRCEAIHRHTPAKHIAVFAGVK